MDLVDLQTLERLVRWSERQLEEGETLTLADIKAFANGFADRYGVARPFPEQPVGWWMEERVRGE